jgi:drug/metabolite transporter (DMT)-like permease
MDKNVVLSQPAISVIVPVYNVEKYLTRCLDSIFNQQFSGFFEVVQDVKVQESVLFILVLGVVGTGIANILFFKLIQISSPVFATSVTYLIPVVAFCWGLLDNEMLTSVQFFGAFIILIGVYLSAKK